MSEGVNTHAGVTVVNIVALAASKQVFPCSQHPAASTHLSRWVVMETRKEQNAVESVTELLLDRQVMVESVKLCDLVRWSVSTKIWAV